MPGQTRANPPPSSDDDRSGSDRRAYPFRWSDHFKDELAALGPPMRQRVVAKLQRFEQDWKANRSYGELAGPYRLKPINRPRSVADLNITQVRPQNKVRVYFTSVDEQRINWYLGAIFKDPSSQQQEIDSVGHRARTIREEPHGSR